MPLKQCEHEGMKGWKWGDAGSCMTGPDGKKKAMEQGRAIEMEKHKRGEHSEMGAVNALLLEEQIREIREQR